jgi:NAD(P)-dependent dehydrogenase (short-subunit alcohol dehydrogenase family)
MATRTVPRHGGTRGGRRPLDGLSALVTGGSRGLGLLIARELLDRGCSVTVAARDAAELGRAAGLLGAAEGRPVRTAVCDVGDRAAVAALVAGTAREHGGLDIVIANAGIIQVGPAEAAGAEGFASALRVIFDGALNTSLEALPHLRRSPAGGRLALIGSIGGLLAVPHLVPYACAKHAVAALAEGLHAEEAAHGVSVTAVHPGLMRTGSHLNAEFGGDAAREFAWFSALAGLPGLSMDAERAAARIVGAVQRRRARVVLTPAAKAADLLHGVAPGTVTRLSGVAARLLPAAPPHPGEPVPGAALPTPHHGPAAKLRAWASALNDRAAPRFNETNGAS